MSKRRSVILSMVLGGRSQAETARLHEVSESTVSRWVARSRGEGEAAFEPRSRRPKTSPTKVATSTVELIVSLRRRLSEEGLEAGPHTIHWHLQRHHDVAVSDSSIRRYLLAAELITPEPRSGPGLPTCASHHSRYALSVTAHRHVTTPVVVEAFTRTVENTGIPASVLSDNGMYFTTRFAGGRGGRNRFETLLAEFGVDRKHSRPNHPTTCGKVERFQ